jgi:class 3 adenylate cyclase
MPALPTGTVTFIFTDIEGSTTLLERLGDRRFADVLLVAFSRARGAVGAAVAAQRALTKYVWPDGASPRVRMGMHIRWDPARTHSWGRRNCGPI